MLLGGRRRRDGGRIRRDRCAGDPVAQFLAGDHLRRMRSAGQQAGHPVKGSAAFEPTITKFPKRRPLSTWVSASTATSSSAATSVAACDLANRSPGPSAIFTAITPFGREQCAACR